MSAVADVGESPDDALKDLRLGRLAECGKAAAEVTLGFSRYGPFLGPGSQTTVEQT
jgi:hypothetical protein